MDRSTVISLVKVEYAQDGIGQFAPIETKRDVFAQISSVSLTEWSTGGEHGLKPEYRATMFAPDYEGEEIVEYSGKRYSVYRTYLGKNETIDLYLEKKVGTDG